MPRWQHNCDRCEFKGTVRLNQVYDVWLCPGSVLGPMVVARYGDSGDEYASTEIKNLAKYIALLDTPEHAQWFIRVGPNPDALLPYQKAMIIGLLIGDWTTSTEKPPAWPVALQA